MIKSSIQTKFNHQYCAIQSFNNDVYVADYTEQTKTHTIKKSVEFFSPNSPTDIDSFLIKNDKNLSIDGIKFDNSSFVRGNGTPKTQCEAVFFPTTSESDSWALFCELKYSSLQRWNEQNLKKALKQLFRTRYYYVQENIINLSNTTYLIASLPKQPEPFRNFTLHPSFLLRLKKRRNIILRLQNQIGILNDKLITV